MAVAVRYKDDTCQQRAVELLRIDRESHNITIATDESGNDTLTGLSTIGSERRATRAACRSSTSKIQYDVTTSTARLGDIQGQLHA